MKHKTLIIWIGVISIATFVPAICRACACGCGVFEVGTSSMIPQGTGGLFSVEYDYQDQNQNWSGSHSAPAANNDDKEIRTSFYTLGVQYMFNRNWGIQAELPVANRYFQTTGGASGSDIVSFNWTDLGDFRIQGIYTGFFPDQSLGILFGAKLPTGNDIQNDSFGSIDRDSELGTGSTDLLLGGFYRNNLTKDGRIDWFTQINLDLPVTSREQYRPGLETDVAVGIYYNGLAIHHMGITPIGQIIGSVRTSDTGAAASSPVASGYERIFLSPGIEFDLHPVMLYADVELPVYEHITGNQLVASNLFKMILSYKF